MTTNLVSYLSTTANIMESVRFLPSLGDTTRLFFGTAILLLAFTATLLLFFFLHVSQRKSRRHSATVLVLGDIGRSPRMMYHSESLARHGWETFVIGYGDTPPIPSLLTEPRVRLLHIASPPGSLLALPWVLRAPIRTVYQVYSVLHLYFWEISFFTEILLVQNPPSIPTLALAQLMSYLGGSKLIIDWHNTGYSILAMRLGQNSPLVRLAKWFEATFGRKAYAHLFVTRALATLLYEEWGLMGKKAILYDRPPSNFRRTHPMEQLEVCRSFELSLMNSFFNDFSLFQNPFPSHAILLWNRRQSRQILLLSPLHVLHFWYLPHPGQQTRTSLFYSPHWTTTKPRSPPPHFPNSWSSSQAKAHYVRTSKKQWLQERRINGRISPVGAFSFPHEIIRQC